MIREQQITDLLLQSGPLASSDIHTKLEMGGEKVSLITVKRDLTGMEKRGLIVRIGSGRGTEYQTSIIGRLFAEIDAHAYCNIEPDRRYGLTSYNFDLFDQTILFV